MPLPTGPLPLAFVPTKLPFRTLFCDWPSIRMPFPRLPETRLPSGGTTKTAGSVPLLPVGSFACPVLESTKSVPPIVLLAEPSVIRMPFWPLAIAALPSAVVPMRLSTMTLPDDPWSERPLPALPEMTFATTPEAPVGLMPILLLADEAAMKTPSPALPNAVPFP